MRFNILLSITFLATFAAGLVAVPTDDSLASRDLETRERVVDNFSDAMIFKREPRSSTAKKARIAVEAPAKAAEKADRKAASERARKAYEVTNDLPHRHSTYHIPGSATTGKPDYTYTGKDVRKAVYDSHKEEDRIKPLSKTQQKKSPLKGFNNRPHVDPTGHPGTLKPIDHMKVDAKNPHYPPGREWPLPNYHNPGTPGPARVITQKTKNGDRFQGVVSHDQSRGPGSKGYNDHFRVPIKRKKQRN